MNAPGRHRRPQSVLVIVYTPEREVLLLQRKRPFDFWQSVTGSLDPDETHEQAARRELFEETGLGDDGLLRYSGNVRTFIIDPRWRHRYAPGVTENTEYEYRYRVPVRCDIDLDREEHAAFEWLPVRRAAELVWSWTNREALEALEQDL